MLFDEVDWGLWHEKNQHFVRYHAHPFFKKTPINTEQKKMSIRKRDDRPPHQKSSFFIASKAVDFSIQLTLKESLEMFITEYVVARLVIS